MQQQVDIQPQIPLKETHKLVRLKLRLQKVLDGHERAGAGHLDVAATALDAEHADLVARDGQVDLVPVALGDALPRDEHALVVERPRAVLVRAELGHAARPLELALVVVLLGEGKEEAFFAGGGLTVSFFACVLLRGRRGAYPFLFWSVAIACSM